VSTTNGLTTHKPPRAAIMHARNWDELHAASSVIWDLPAGDPERAALCDLIANRTAELRGAVSYDDWRYNQHTDISA